MARKRKSLVDKYIEAQQLRDISRCLRWAFCEHNWEEYIGTYKCKKCGYYVGTNDELQKAIKKEIGGKE